MRTDDGCRTPRGLKVQSIGRGEPLLLIHGSVVAPACDPLARALADTERFRVVRYVRRGYGDTAIDGSDLSIPEGARDARDVLEAAGDSAAHVLGHSLGAHIALQLALDAPARVRSLVLLEPAFAQVPAGEAAKAGLVQVLDLYRSGRRREALERFLAAFGGSNSRAAFDAVLPHGWFERSLKECSTYFEWELPSALSWVFDGDAAARIHAPALLVSGAATHPVFPQTHELLASWLPDARAIVIPGAGHFTPTFAPRLVADAVTRFASSLSPVVARG